MSRDLMHTDEVKAIVREAYAAIDSSTEAVAYKLYSPAELAHVPRSAIEGALGVGNHLRFVEIEAGETSSTSAAAPASTPCLRPAARVRRVV